MLKNSISRCNPVHRRLPETSQQAHQAMAQGNTEHLSEIGERVDILAAQLWGLIERELAGICKSLREN